MNIPFLREKILTTLAFTKDEKLNLLTYLDKYSEENLIKLEKIIDEFNENIYKEIMIIKNEVKEEIFKVAHSEPNNSFIQQTASDSIKALDESLPEILNIE